MYEARAKERIAAVACKELPPWGVAGQFTDRSTALFAKVFLGKIVY